MSERKVLAEAWVFKTNGHKWSSNDDTAGDNFASFLAGYDARNDEVKREFKEGMLYAATILMNASGGDAEKYAEFIRFAARENSGYCSDE